MYLKFHEISQHVIYASARQEEKINYGFFHKIITTQSQESTYVSLETSLHSEGKGSLKYFAMLPVTLISLPPGVSTLHTRVGELQADSVGSQGRSSLGRCDRDHPVPHPSAFPQKSSSPWSEVEQFLNLLFIILPEYFIHFPLTCPTPQNFNSTPTLYLLLHCGPWEGWRPLMWLRCLVPTKKHPLAYSRPRCCQVGMNELGRNTTFCCLFLYIDVAGCSRGLFSS